jgi:hypothetical protein
MMTCQIRTTVYLPQVIGYWESEPTAFGFQRIFKDGQPLTNENKRMQKRFRDLLKIKK